MYMGVLWPIGLNIFESVIRLVEHNCQVWMIYINLTVWGA